MRITVDIPEKILKDAMRHAGAKTKRDAILTALEEYNHRKSVEMLLSMAGKFPDFPTNEEIEAADMECEERMKNLWER